MPEARCPRTGCGNSMAGRGPRAIYCSKFCSNKVSYQRFTENNPGYQTAWAKKNPEAKKASGDAWAAKNPGKRTAMWKAWKAADPDRFRVYNNEKCRRRRARKRAAQHGAEYERVDNHVLRDRQNGLCSLCFEPMYPAIKFPDWGAETVEHDVPLSRGGAHNYLNCSLAHWRCNHEKRARTPEEYLALLPA